MNPKTWLRRTKLVLALALVAVLSFGLHLASAQKREVVWSEDEKPIADQIHGLRGLADDVRAGTTKDLALKIRKLPATKNKLRLAVGLAGLSTEGDFGHDTLQGGYHFGRHAARAAGALGAIEVRRGRERPRYTGAGLSLY